MACPGGQYEEFIDGQQVRLADGIHFTFTGGDVFASRIWPFVLRLGPADGPSEATRQPTRRRVLWSVWGNGSSNSFIFRTVTSS